MCALGSLLVAVVYIIAGCASLDSFLFFLGDFGLDWELARFVWRGNEREISG